MSTLVEVRHTTGFEELKCLREGADERRRGTFRNGGVQAASEYLDREFDVSWLEHLCPRAFVPTSRRGKPGASFFRRALGDWPGRHRCSETAGGMPMDTTARRLWIVSWRGRTRMSCAKAATSFRLGAGTAELSWAR
jgi:hypothetical protein